MASAENLTDKLLMEEYTSSVDNRTRNYYLYLPQGYTENDQKKWPVMLVLHGNGERGDGNLELPFILHHGPLYEAWIQKRNLPFIMVAPQLHMFNQDKLGIDYIDNRRLEAVPKRLPKGVPSRPEEFTTQEKMTGKPAVDMGNTPSVLPDGWDLVEKDIMGILDSALAKYRTDSDLVYLTGISYGGFGTWFLASKYPQKFAAIAPVVGWGHPDLMKPIAEHQIPVWVFAGGRDSAVLIQHFYAGLNRLESLGHKNVRFTIHQDMEHDAWRRIYAGDDIYTWLLSHQRNKEGAGT